MQLTQTEKELIEKQIDEKLDEIFELMNRIGLTGRTKITHKYQEDYYLKLDSEKIDGGDN